MNGLWLSKNHVYFLKGWHYMSTEIAKGPVTATCRSGHEFNCNTDTLEELLDLGQCSVCEDEITDVNPEIIHIQCADCEQYEGNLPWREYVENNYTFSCPFCNEAFGTDGNICIVDSKTHQTGVFKSFVERLEHSVFIRDKRPDYWDLVIHFTEKEELLSILKEKQIRASSTGYFHKPNPEASKAVCLTETPIEFAQEIAARFGPYGIAFKKDDIKLVGGGPTLDMNPAALKAQKRIGFAPEVIPFINIINERFNYVYEREWRVPKDISFDEITPVCLILPYQKIDSVLTEQGWELILDAGWQYSVLQPSNLL